MVVELLSMRNFRGVPGDLTISLLDERTNSPTSVILHGENGSGKSSIVDALEFGLRGRLSRRGLHGEKRKREVRNLAVSGAPGVVVSLRNGSSIRRGGGIHGTGLPDSHAEVADGFQFCPVVIRRQDVETFWAVPPELRQDFFFDYLRDSSHSISLAAELDERHRRLQDSSDRIAATSLALKRRLDRDVTLPRFYKDTKVFLTRTLLRRYGVISNKKRIVPPEIYRPFVEYQHALQKAEELQKEYQSDPSSKIADDKLREVLAKVSGRVSEDFAAVARKTWISEVTVVLGEGAALAIDVRLSNGRTADPIQVLNEAALDLLALLILVEVHVECAHLGQGRLLVLDDVFQSVDSVHRVRALDHVIDRLRGWQLVLTLHDRLWLELARAAMQRNGQSALKVITVRSTSHDMPPELLMVGNGPLNDLMALLREPISPELLAGACGRALEQLCDRLSVSLETSVTRRRGDKYSLGDLWPGVKKALKKAEISGLADAVSTTDKFLTLRNLGGAHYNAWADTMVDQEAADFAEGVVRLWRFATCPTCGAPLSLYRAAEGNRSLIDFGCNCARPAA